MNLEETIKECPKSYEALKQHIILGLKEMQKAMIAESGVEMELPDIEGFLTEDMIIHTLKSNVRVLYDFFDKNKIYVTISLHTPSWVCQVDNGIGTAKDSRFEAELEGFAQAFKLLEGKL